MDISFTDEQQLLHDTAARLGDSLGVTDPDSIPTGAALDAQWHQLVELGVPMLRSPALCGLEASGVETAIFRDVQSSLYSAAFNADGTEIVTADENGSALVWDAKVPERPPQDLIAESCASRLGSLTKLTRDEMQLAGFPDSAPRIDVCAGIVAASPLEPAPPITGTVPQKAQ